MTFPRPAVAALLAALVACSTAAPPAADPVVPTSPTPTGSRAPATRTPRPEPPREVQRERVPVREVRVLRITDGDTIVVAFAGRVEDVRVIGVDTPEVGTPFASAATARTASLAPPGSTVFLEIGVEERDRYGRLLAYVWLERPVSRARDQVRAKMLEAKLLLAGLAVVSTYPPNVEYVDHFVVFQRVARATDAGLWGSPAQGSCDPSYPDVCIPPPPPDLDCDDVEHRNFRVTGGDPHRFDGDGNGRGCES